jgi:peptide/nickel transport system ATP-binding protein
LLAPPLHPYTELLVSSVPELRCGWLEQIGAPQPAPGIGALPEDVTQVQALCGFIKRCPVRIDGVCNVKPPVHSTLRNGKEILCHHTEEELQRLAVRKPAVEEVH